MTLFHPLNLLSAAIMLVLINGSISRGESNPDNKQADQTIIGSWQAEKVSILVKPGKKMTYPAMFDDRVFSVFIGNKSLALRQGSELFAEMTYNSATQRTATTIDGQFQGEGVLGIYELKGDQLKISLNNVNNGRPENYNNVDNDCVFYLRRFQGQPLMIIDTADGGMYPLAPPPEFTTCGSPNWSPDGGKIALDCWRTQLNENHTQSRVFVINPDGSSPKDLGDGALPSFSSDGKQIAYFRYDNNAGVWIMNSDGSDNHLIDKDGTCARWSPKSNEVAYGTKNNLCILDFKTNKRRMLLDTYYERIAWGFSWSPDAKWICYKGILPGGKSETALVSAEGQSKGFKILAPSKATPELTYTESSFSWSPDGKNILIPTTMAGDINTQLYLLDPEGNTPPRKLAGQDPNCRNFSSSWSPDGKKIVLAFWPGKTPRNDNNDSQDGGIFKRIFGL